MRIFGRGPPGWRPGVGCRPRLHAEPVAAAPSTAKLERLFRVLLRMKSRPEKLAGAIVLIQQHGLPVYFKRFGVQDVATQAAHDAGYHFFLRSTR